MSNKTLVTYVPHGIDANMFKPLDKNSPTWNALQEENLKLRKDNPNRFVVFWNNRNIHRKHPGDVVLAFKEMCMKVDAAGGDAKKDCVLLMHTAPVDGNGTHIPAIVEELCPEYPVAFSNGVIPSEQLNVMYNVADVVINIASNEGFGLGTAEAIMAGTPIVVNVTGGLQDQCGFINPETGTYFTAEDYVKIGTLHRREKWGHLEHGKWVKPIWPSNISLQGSVPTPYIFDDRADYVEAGQALYEWYQTPRDERKEAGLAGREFALQQDTALNRDRMCQLAIDSIEKCFESFVPRQRYQIHST